MKQVHLLTIMPLDLDDFNSSDGLRFQDGATTANNPAVVALQQVGVAALKLHALPPMLTRHVVK